MAFRGTKIYGKNIFWWRANLTFRAISSIWSILSFPIIPGIDTLESKICCISDYSWTKNIEFLELVPEKSICNLLFTGPPKSRIRRGYLTFRGTSPGRRISFPRKVISPKLRPMPYFFRMISGKKIQKFIWHVEIILKLRDIDIRWP